MYLQIFSVLQCAQVLPPQQSMALASRATSNAPRAIPLNPVCVLLAVNPPLVILVAASAG